MAEDDSHLVPDSPAGYRPILGDEYKSVKLDLADPRWKQATEDAHAGKLSHAAFKIMLNREAKRVMDAHVEKSRASAKPAAPAVPYKEMSMSQKLAHYGHG
jgi:hypothetical protein